MNWGEVVLLSILEGLTEFLPISSTAHLLLAGKLLGISLSGFQKLWVVVIQSGAILAVIPAFLRLLKKDLRLLEKIALSFLPTATVGFFLHHLIKNTFFSSYLLMAWMLILVGGVFILVEWLLKKGVLKSGRHLKTLSFKEAFIIGLVQALAVVPGVSRAGAVIVIMMILGFTRREAALYSFSLAVPTILAASVFDFLKTGTGLSFGGNQFSFLLGGFLLSFLTAYMAANWFLRFLKRRSLLIFAVYRFLLAGAILLLF